MRSTALWGRTSLCRIWHSHGNATRALFKSLIDNGHSTLFSNPGTSEILLVDDKWSTENGCPVLGLEVGPALSFTVAGTEDSSASPRSLWGPSPKGSRRHHLSISIVLVASKLNRSNRIQGNHEFH